MSRPTWEQRTEDEQRHRRAEHHQQRTDREPVDGGSDEDRIGGDHGVTPTGCGSTYDVFSLTCSINLLTLGSMRSSIGLG